jgi:hypothetical protein
VGRHVDRERVLSAKVIGAACRLRDLTLTRPDAYAELRSSWPELAERIDRLAELVDWNKPRP